MKVAVIGAGSWGTALAQTLALNGQNVGLWARKDSVVHGVNHEHVNPRYLSDTVLSGNIVATTSYCDALLRAKAAVIVTPSNLLRGVARAIGDVVDDDFPIIICSKGVEADSGYLPVGVFESELGNKDRLAVLSGPNHAEEVIKAKPAGTVIASSGQDTAVMFRDLFASPTFRTYTSDDVTGVELCAAFKNVIAIAVGVAYGLGYGDNTAAMLMTRGLAEMARLGTAMGARSETFAGLAGMGDLIVTCGSMHSRNHRAGILIGQGHSPEEAVALVGTVEGYLAAKTVWQLAQKMQVDMPIAEQCYRVCYEGDQPKEAIRRLMARPKKHESEILW